MIYKCKYFHLVELLPRDFYNKHIHAYRGLLWYVFDRRVLITLDRLRERYGITYMNMWRWNKDGNQRCGYRPQEMTFGAALSQHRFGRAGDLSFGSVTADEVRADLSNNPDNKAFEFITAIEDGAFAPTWFHFDCRNYEGDLIIVKPLSK